MKRMKKRMMIAAAVMTSVLAFNLLSGFGLFSGDAAVYALLRFGTGCLCLIPLMI